MVKYKITYDREGCIGAIACSTVNPKYWDIDKEKKAVLKGGKLNKKTGKYELIIDEQDLKQNLESAEVCPVVVIKIEKIDDSDGKNTNQ